jgi:CO dehydrogenase nickel-insertion accessory protein CooC1
MDMGGGAEPLARGACARADLLLAVSDASRAGVDMARAIERLAWELGVARVGFVGNMIRNDREEIFIRANFPRERFFGLAHCSEIERVRALGIHAQGILAKAPPDTRVAQEIEAVARRALEEAEAGAGPGAKAGGA